MPEPETESMPWAKDEAGGPRRVVQEWLVANGLGGYAAGTVAGVCTRRFHGLLIASLSNPLGRVMMLNHLSEEVRLPDGSMLRLGGAERAPGELDVSGPPGEFRLEHGLPVWRWELPGATLEKSVVLPHLQNTVYVRYRLLSGAGPVRLRARPSMHFRPHEGRVDQPLRHPYAVRSVGRRLEIYDHHDSPPLRLLVYGDHASFVLDGGGFHEIFYRMEHGRGYDARGTVWTPGYARADLLPGAEVSIAASCEPWEVFGALEPADAFAVELERRRRLIATAHPRARSGPAAELVLAADQFVITPNFRVLDAARTHAIGDEIRSVVAGYHWFTDWGRDTMISLEGLTLATGRSAEAAYILRMFARHVRDGLIPNFFPEGRQEGVYHTADATLWFFHALERYAEWSKDWGMLETLLPTLEGIVRAQTEGTRFGIGVDPADGLLRQGAEGYQLTWMDAKVEGWVVTPRRGKTVEINALWYNALRLMESWERRFGRGEAARGYGTLASRAAESFNRRFWNEDRGCLFDLVDGDAEEQALLRPNQLLAISLSHPVLAPERWRPVLEAVERELLTPVGLRSLSRDAAAYRPRYDGDLRSRDAAYHQGTVWAWLIGPYVDAYLKVHPDDRAGARRLLRGFIPHLEESCVGSISEIFDAEPPFAPRGCVAQAWSVAEVLRAWIKTAD